MEKKILEIEKKAAKIKRKIEDAQLERIQKKAVYDAWNVVMEGQRRAQAETENIVKGLLENYTNADEAVKDLIKQQSELVNEKDKLRMNQDKLNIETKTESDES